MKLKRYPKIKEKVYSCILKNGMQVFYLPQKNFQEKMAIIATSFGSFHSLSYLDDKKTKIPLGAAHFLEHRMFTIDQDDATQYFADLGATSNAYTTYDRTAYYFKTKEHFYENLEILLRMCDSFDSTTKQIENEKQIIIEELNMYQDDPYTKLLMTLYQNAYQIHPIRYDIGGTVESVHQTDKEVLNACFQKYYHPSNLTLVIAGDLDENEIETFLNQHLIREKSEPHFHKLSFNEPSFVMKKKEIIQGNVSLPLFGILFKLPPYNKKQDQQKELLKVEILLNYFFSSSGIYTEPWLKKKIIQSGIGYYHCCNIDLNFIILYNINVDYENTIHNLLSIFDKKHWDMSKSDFTRIKNKMTGEFLKSYSEGCNLAKEFLTYHLDGCNYFKEIDKLNEITIEDVHQVYNSICDAPSCIVIERGDAK